MHCIVQLNYVYIGYVLFANNKKNLAHSSQIISEPLLLSSTCTTTKVPIRILLGNFCHIHCYCCRCCSCCCCCTIWKKHYQKRKRITAKRTFFYCRREIFYILHEFIHVGCGILTRA